MASKTDNYIHIPAMQNLAIASLKNIGSGLPAVLYDVSENYIESLYNALCDSLLSGEIDYFYHDDSNENENNYLQYIFTRSVKELGKIQVSCIWFKNGVAVPLSDGQGVNYKDFNKNGHTSVDVDIYYGSL
jgi:hypothetical protein